MRNAYKILKLFSHTTTLKAGLYRFATKEPITKRLKYNNINTPLLGATESHALPIRLNDKKISMYNIGKKISDYLLKRIS